MAVVHRILSVATRGRCDVLDITDRVAQIVAVGPGIGNTDLEGYNVFNHTQFNGVGTSPQ